MLFMIQQLKQKLFITPGKQTVKNEEFHSMLWSFINNTSDFFKHLIQIILICLYSLCVETFQ